MIWPAYEKFHIKYYTNEKKNYLEYLLILQYKTKIPISIYISVTCLNLNNLAGPPGSMPGSMSVLRRMATGLRLRTVWRLRFHVSTSSKSCDRVSLCDVKSKNFDEDLGIYKQILQPQIRHANAWCYNFPHSKVGPHCSSVKCWCAASNKSVA